MPKLLPAFARACFAVLLSSGFAAAPDLATELQRCMALATDISATDEFSRSVGEQSLPTLKQVEADLAAGRRWAALHRLASVHVNFGGVAYVNGLAADQRDEAAFEEQWKKVGALLEKAGSREEVIGKLETAVLRAEAEATQPQAGILREASLEYGRNTELVYGFFTLGSALAANDFVDLCRSLDAHTGKHAPKLRSVRHEIDALQDELLAAYRPPLSVERHSEFIGASSALKEARALDAQGRYSGALLRYLTASARCALLLDKAAPPPAAELEKQLDDFAARIAAGETDHSIGSLYLELARAEIAAAPGTSPPIAVAVAAQSLPRYFAALEPAPAQAAAPAAPKHEVAITLVRWPFT